MDTPPPIDPVIAARARAAGLARALELFPEDVLAAARTGEGGERPGPFAPEDEPWPAMRPWRASPPS